MTKRTLSMIVLIISIMNAQSQIQVEKQEDHSDKRILARGCDPELSKSFAEYISPKLGNPTYIPTTSDDDFLYKIKNEKWDIIYFAPGACRYSAADMQIPGGISSTAGWSLDEYKDFIYQFQDEGVIIVETPYESKSIELLREALKKADIE